MPAEAPILLLVKLISLFITRRNASSNQSRFTTSVLVGGTLESPLNCKFERVLMLCCVQKLQYRSEGELLVNLAGTNVNLSHYKSVS